MILYINTTQGKDIEIAIKDDDSVVAEKRFEADRKQAEKLLPEIDKLLKKNKIKLSDLKKMEVENRGGSFTSLRIGVVTANALGYALGIPVFSHNIKHTAHNKGKKFNIIQPEYDREPNITEKKKK